MLIYPSFSFTQVSRTFIGCPGLPSTLSGSLSTQSLAELFSVLYLRVPQPFGWPQRFEKVVVKMFGLGIRQTEFVSRFCHVLAV